MKGRISSPSQPTRPIPTTSFLAFDTRRMLIGEPANQALLEGTEGRVMRALSQPYVMTSLRSERDRAC